MVIAFSCTYGHYELKANGVQLWTPATVPLGSLYTGCFRVTYTTLELNNFRCRARRKMCGTNPKTRKFGNLFHKRIMKIGQQLAEIFAIIEKIRKFNITLMGFLMHLNANFSSLSGY